MVYEVITQSSIHFFAKKIALENGIETVYNIYSCCRHLDFTQTWDFHQELQFQYSLELTINDRKMLRLSAYIFSPDNRVTNLR